MSWTYKFSSGIKPQASVPERAPLEAEHVDLFPTRIWQLRLHALSAHFPGWLSEIERLRAANPKPAGRSNRLGWNSDDKTVLHQQPFIELHGAIRSSCQFAFKQMGLADPPFRLESWINMHDRGGFNFLHMHEGCLLSGVFYLQVPEGSGCLTFRDPRPYVVSSPIKGATVNAHSDIQLRPEGGLLVLFPSWLEHYVEPHDNDLPRIAISFNALAK